MSEQASIRAAVIGVGHLGRHHARILSALPGVELAGIVDINPERAQEIAAAHGTAVIRDAGSLIGQVDAVVVATPTASHAAGRRGRCCEAGVAVLVEKPLARSLAEADELIAGGAGRARDARGRPHRAVQSGRRGGARPLLTAPRFIEVHRLGTFPDRSLDIDVVFDLMIHDLDVVLSIVGFAGRGHRRRRRAGADAEDRHRERAPAVRERLHRQPHGEPHQPRSHAEDPLLPARLLRRRSTTRRRSSRCGGWSARRQACRRSKAASVAVRAEEPLKRELEDFVDAVRDATRRRVVTGEDGRRALALAEDVDRWPTMTTVPIR